MRRWSVLLLLVTGWWSASGIINVVNSRRMAAAGGLAIEWGHLVTTEMISALLWVPTTLASLWLAFRWPLGRGGLKGVAAHFAVLVATIVGRAVLVVATDSRIHWFDNGLPPFPEVLLISVYNNLFMVLLITLGAHALYFAKAHREREAQLARAELNALKAQVHPHFLFNALNTIVALIHRQPETAERMITSLGELLRRSLDSDDRLHIPLAEELHTVRSYLDIEEARFADRLQVTWDIAPSALTAAVPPLILQPLVENAIKHGLWPRPAAGHLHLHAAIENGQLLLQVSDDGLGIRENGTGVGLSNTRARLQQLFGQRQQFSLVNRSGGGAVATIRLPYRVLSAEGDKHDPGVAGRRRAAGQTATA